MEAALGDMALTITTPVLVGAAGGALVLVETG
jgi:hypothetical protein